MSQFVYFIPKRSAINGKVIADAGLSYALPDPKRNPVEFRGGVGPGDAGGGVYATYVPPDTSSSLVNLPPTEAWHRCNDGAFWLACLPDSPPTPEDLQRDRFVPGHGVTLDDGNEWTVPLIRPLVGSTVLPRTMTVDAAGDIQYEIKPEFATITEAAELVFRQYLHDVTQAIAADQSVGPYEHEPGPLYDFSQWFDIAADALAVNYRVSRWELSALGCCSTDNVREIGGAMIDMPTIRRLSSDQLAAKKKTDLAVTHDGSGIDDGAPPPAAGSTTKPLTPTSGSTHLKPTPPTTATDPQPSATLQTSSERSPLPAEVDHGD